ncbi:helix-turn-helix domain-containing protein [Acetobacterium tundrae]|uniref:Helix-turn-helix domain-containing protein n=1 Tax=Acetobacterium tundrae TaxID=132932 RepID=A0ABR6WPU4_9FIRM|nr:helix-turn-helix transcriptional regulator [Acetobacterium tundrae]MBC3798470.1 helix-turn-helix domain-containing protein [Acetobacterium tundrae]
MNERCNGVLKTYRDRAGLKQEEAAMELNVSPHTLYNYESYSADSRRNMPPEEIVLAMMDLYCFDEDPIRMKAKKTYMGILYLCETNYIFKHIFSNVELLDLPTAFLRHQVEYEDVRQLECGMRKVIIDNRIDENESDLASAFLKELMESAMASMSLAFSAIEKTTKKKIQKTKEIHLAKETILNEGRSTDYEQSLFAVR